MNDGRKRRKEGRNLKEFKGRKEGRKRKKEGGKEGRKKWEGGKGEMKKMEGKRKKGSHVGTFHLGGGHFDHFDSLLQVDKGHRGVVRHGALVELRGGAPTRRNPDQGDGAR